MFLLLLTSLDSVLPSSYWCLKCPCLHPLLLGLFSLMFTSLVCGFIVLCRYYLYSVSNKKHNMDFFLLKYYLYSYTLGNFFWTLFCGACFSFSPPTLCAYKQEEHSLLTVHCWCQLVPMPSNCHLSSRLKVIFAYIISPKHKVTMWDF